MQERPFEPVLELSPEAADMDVDDVGARVEMIVPYLLEQHSASNHAPLITGKIFQQQIFARLQVELLASTLHRARQWIDLEVADGQTMVGGVDPRLAPAK